MNSHVKIYRLDGSCTVICQMFILDFQILNFSALMVVFNLKKIFFHPKLCVLFMGLEGVKAELK